nr:superoxide dismutase [mn] [Quercus suber]
MCSPVMPLGADSCYLVFYDSSKSPFPGLRCRTAPGADFTPSDGSALAHLTFAPCPSSIANRPRSESTYLTYTNLERQHAGQTRSNAHIDGNLDGARDPDAAATVIDRVVASSGPSRARVARRAGLDCVLIDIGRARISSEEEEQPPSDQDAVVQLQHRRAPAGPTGQLDDPVCVAAAVPTAPSNTSCSASLTCLCPFSFLSTSNSTLFSAPDPSLVNMSYTLPQLGYAYEALEPHFDKETMEIHHSKHHQTYVNNLNGAIKEHGDLGTLAIDALITKLDQIPADKRTFIRNNAGGHSNHSFFWKNLKTGTTLGSPLKEAIEKSFGTVDDFKAQFETAAAKVFGSGWAWLVKKDGTLKIVTTSNQDSPLMAEGVVGAAATGFPIIGLDVWEHAYYLKFQNRRPDYIKAYWSVVNWDEAAKRFEQSP